MANHTMISKKYAKALFDLAVEMQIIEVIGNDLARILEIICNNEKYKNFFIGQHIPKKIKYVFLNTILENLSLDRLSFNFMIMLAKNNRLYLFKYIVRCYNFYCQELRGEQTVDITTAYELSQSDNLKIASQLSKTLSKKVLLNTKVDPTILEGMIIIYNSKMLNLSLSHRLSAIIKSAKAENII